MPLDSKSRDQRRPSWLVDATVARTTGQRCEIIYYRQLSQRHIRFSTGVALSTVVLQEIARLLSSISKRVPSSLLSLKEKCSLDRSDHPEPGSASGYRESFGTTVPIAPYSMLLVYVLAICQMIPEDPLRSCYPSLVQTTQALDHPPGPCEQRDSS